MTDWVVERVGHKGDGIARGPDGQQARAPRLGDGRLMAEKKAYPLRISADVLAAAQKWADDELRSLNAQIEYALRDALRKAGRLPKADDTTEDEA